MRLKGDSVKRVGIAVLLVAASGVVAGAVTFSKIEPDRCGVSPFKCRGVDFQARFPFAAVPDDLDFDSVPDRILVTPGVFHYKTMPVRIAAVGLQIAEENQGPYSSYARIVLEVQMSPLAATRLSDGEWGAFAIEASMGLGERGSFIPFVVSTGEDDFILHPAVDPSGWPYRPGRVLGRQTGACVVCGNSIHVVRLEILRVADSSLDSARQSDDLQFIVSDLANPGSRFIQQILSTRVSSADKLSRGGNVSEFGIKWACWVLED